MSAPPPRSRSGTDSPVELAAAGAVAVVATAALAAWAAGEVAGRLWRGRWPTVPVAASGPILARLVRNPRRPAMAWPVSARELIPGATAFYAVLLAIAAALSAVAVWGWRRWRRWCGPSRPGRLGRDGRSREAGRWADLRDLRSLVVRRPVPGRLTLGRLSSPDRVVASDPRGGPAPTGRLLATEARSSLLVLGPTQTGKTTGLAIPAILEWPGPVVATSIKNDLVRHTRRWREGCGRVWVYDPTAATGLPTAQWTPLAWCRDWRGAQRMAAWLCTAARVGGLTDADFWYAAAAKLLAPLLLAAATSAATMADVVRWLDSQESTEVYTALVAAGVEEAATAAAATWRRDDRQRSSVYTTAESVMSAFADPGVAAASVRADVDPALLLEGAAHTLYLCAPAHEQARLRPLFATIVSQVLTAAFERAAGASDGIVDPPLLVVLDEAANIAPLAELDGLASTAAGHGIQLVTVWQDFAQISARYGPRAHSVVNNHRAKLVLSGISDPATLDHISRLVGDAPVDRVSVSHGPAGQRSRTEGTEHRRLVSPATLRGIAPGHAVLVYGHLPPAGVALRRWYEDPFLGDRVAGGADGRAARL